MMLTDDALHAAMLRWLIVGPEVPYIHVREVCWSLTKAETRAMYAERFPRNMDQFKTKKGKR